MIIWTYFKISLALAIFWGAIIWLFRPDFALLVGAVVFVFSLCALSFNYGAK